MKDKNTEIETTVAGILMDPQSNSPIVILKDVNSNVCLPIWIALPEATAIAASLKKITIARPMTHDLLRDVIEILSVKVIKVVITSLVENTYLANIEIANGEILNIIDARPSDAIALAVRVNCPIYVSSNVLEQAKVTLVAVNVTEGEEEFEFRNPVDDTESIGFNFANIEKEKWFELLEAMDPDDFKYKM